MQKAAESNAAIGDGSDAYQLIVSDLVSLIEHVQASLQRVEATIASETILGAHEASNIVVLDDVTPRYARAGAALKACDAGLAVALEFLPDPRTRHRSPN